MAGELNGRRGAILAACCGRAVQEFAKAHQS